MFGRAQHARRNTPYCHDGLSHFGNVTFCALRDLLRCRATLVGCGTKRTFSKLRSPHGICEYAAYDAIALAAMLIISASKAVL